MKKNKFILTRRRGQLTLIIAGIIMLVCIDFRSASPQQNLRYSLEIDEEKWDAFSVSITIKNNKSMQLLCGIPCEYPWLLTANESETDISEFDVSGNYGEKLDFYQTNINTWLIDAKGNDFVIITYKIKNRQDRVLGLRLDRRFARLDCKAVFMYVRELQHLPIRIVVRVPHGWKLATGLTQAEQSFEYNVENYNQLIKHTLYLGSFRHVFFNIGDRDAFLILDGRQYFEIGKLGSMLSKITSEQIKLFQDIPFDQYLFIIKLFPEPRHMISKAYANTSIIYANYEYARSDLLTIVREAASNFFQLWNGNRFYPVLIDLSEFNQAPSTSNLWFWYGTSDYYGCLCMVRAGFWSEGEFFDYQIKLINQLFRHFDEQKLSLTMLGSQIMRHDTHKSIAFIRLKGQLCSLLLDLKIRAVTANKRSLDDVMLFMNRWFGDQNIGYSNNDLKRVVNAITGADLTYFFDSFISGTLELPFNEILKTAGLVLEFKTENRPDLGRIILSTENNVIQLLKDGPLEKAGVKVGDKVLSFADQKIFYPQQLEQMVDSLRVGQQIRISTQREGVTLTFVATVVGKPCRSVAIVNQNPQTELQQLIRKTWLTK